MSVRTVRLQLCGIKQNNGWYMCESIGFHSAAHSSHDAAEKHKNYSLSGKIIIQERTL